MPTYCFRCKKCAGEFEIICKFVEREAKAFCQKCQTNEIEFFIDGCANILGPTDSKKGDIEWAGKYNFEKAQRESAAAREQAVEKGISPYRNIDDITSGENFDPSKW
jgi:putative FmdB family regulatory protein